MKDLAIKRNLDEETRKQGVWLVVDGKVEVFSLHITNHDEVIITDNKDYAKIYSIMSLDYYNLLERQQF